MVREYYRQTLPDLPKTTKREINEFLGSLPQEEELTDAQRTELNRRLGEQLLNSNFGIATVFFFLLAVIGLAYVLPRLF